MMYPLKEKGHQLPSLEGYEGACKGSQASQLQWHREEGGMGKMHTQSNGEDGDLCSSSMNGSGQGHRPFVWIKRKGACKD